MLECRSLLIRFKSTPTKVTASPYYGVPDVEASGATMSGALRALIKKLQEQYNREAPGTLVFLAHNSFGTPSIIILSKEARMEALKHVASQK